MDINASMPSIATNSIQNPTKLEVTMSTIKSRLGDQRRKFYKFLKWTKMKSTGSLVETGNYFGTDKTNKWHTFQGKNYLDVYEIYFKEFKSKQVNLLEIGVRDGQSVKMWEEYFQNGKIYGLDIDPRCQIFETERTKIFIGSQDDGTLIDKVYAASGEFDIIIDDGSHVNELTLASFSLLFGKLKSGGIYIIEDLGCSYVDLSDAIKDWPGMNYNSEGMNYNNDRSVMNDFFLEKIKDMDHLQGKIRSIQFWPLICCIIKI